MPREKITHAQGITIAVRSLYGFQDETMSPWYASYVEGGEAIGIKSNVRLENMDGEFVTRAEFGKRLCIASQVHDLIQN